MLKEAKKFILALSTLTGTIIGVGFFSLPYLALKSGILVILAYFLILGFLVLALHLIFGKLALITPDLKRSPGFARYHLGKRGEKIAYFSSIVGMSGAILAYLIVGGEFLAQIFGGKDSFWTLLYFFVGSILIFFGIKKISKMEFLALISFLLILFLVFFQLKDSIRKENFFLSSPSSFFDLFLPYGPILFSFWGASLIPEIEEMLGGKKNYLKWVILTSILISALIYLFFIYLILGVCGQKTPDSGIVGLKTFLAPSLFKIFLFFGFLATFTSFISLGLTLKKIFWYDLKIKKNTSFLLTCFPPLILYSMGIKKFIPVISFVGGCCIGIEAILILLMYQNYLRKKEIKTKKFLVFPLISVFILGIIYQIIYFFRENVF